MWKAAIGIGGRQRQKSLKRRDRAKAAQFLVATPGNTPRQWRFRRDLMLLHSSKSTVTSARDRKGRTDLGEMAQMAAVESLTAIVGPTLPSLFGATTEDVQRAIGRLAGGDRFSTLSREFFARLTQRSLVDHMLICYNA
jgi:hypothetical protein